MASAPEVAKNGEPANAVTRQPAVPARLPLRTAVPLALVGLITGAGLVVYFITGVSLPLGILTVAVLFITASLSLLQRLGAALRASFLHRVRVGIIAGVAATAAYDATRWTLVGLFSLSVNPFEAVPLFGELLVGSASSGVHWAAGIAYHAANGVGFAVAFTIVAGERGPLAGVVWALLLESAMLTFYPGWLDVRAIHEFVSVSALGHVAYGLCLGFVARELLARRPPSQGINLDAT